MQRFLIYFVESYDRATPEQRAQIVIEPDGPRGFFGQTWNVVSPAGYCFAPDRHTQVEPSKKEALKVARETTFEPCAKDCDCFE